MESHKNLQHSQINMEMEQKAMVDYFKQPTKLLVREASSLLQVLS